VATAFRATWIEPSSCGNRPVIWDSARPARMNDSRRDVQGAGCLVSVVVSIQMRKMFVAVRKMFVNARRAEQDVRERQASRNF
jgi:hypothetical protein